MTSTLDRPTITPGDPDAPVVSLSPPTTRRPSWVVAGVVLVALAALLGAYVFNAATDTIRVTVAAGDLTPGQAIGAEDLRVVEIGRTIELRAIAPERQSLILGLTPRSVIPDGTLLNTDLFISSDEVVPDGQVVVGASFGVGAIPTASLATGQTVSVLITTDGTALIASAEAPATTGEAIKIGEGTIWSIEGADAIGAVGETWLSILLEEELETRFAQAASENRIRLSLVNR